MAKMVNAMCSKLENHPVLTIIIEVLLLIFTWGMTIISYTNSIRSTLSFIAQFEKE